MNKLMDGWNENCKNYYYNYFCITQHRLSILIEDSFTLYGY